MDYILGGDPPPPELSRAFDYRAWGVSLFDLPAGELRAINRAMNTYNSLSEYRKAQINNRSAEWTAANPHKWEAVSAMIADRMDRLREADNG